MEKSPQETNQVPQPIEDGAGATDPGSRNVLLDRQNPSMLTPPRTDHGTLPNLKFSFANAHMRLEKGGWAREVTVRELPIATTLAGVNMRLTPGGVRVLMPQRPMLARRGREYAPDTGWCARVALAPE